MSIAEKFTQRFGYPPEIITSAPGRIEFIGNHTDYNGGLVLGAAIDRRLEVALGRAPGAQWVFATDSGGDSVSVPVGKIQRQSGPASWANYPLGILSVFASAGLNLPDGFDFLAAANLPAGAGLSSSAALELASALAFLEYTTQQIPQTQLVQLARAAENNFVGVPCGILDQGVSAFGQAGHLVLIDCAGPKFDTIAIPPAARFWLFNTHTKHALIDGLYATRHRECLAAAEALGVPLLAQADRGRVAAAEGRLPPALFRRARHVTDEHARVVATLAALRAGDLKAVGALLTASHRSSQVLFENSTDELDHLVGELIAVPSVFGARLTGGGFGGAVLALTSQSFDERDAFGIVAKYRRKFGTDPAFFSTVAANGARVQVPDPQHMAAP